MQFGVGFQWIYFCLSMKEWAEASGCFLDAHEKQSGNPDKVENSSRPNKKMNNHTIHLRGIAYFYYLGKDGAIMLISCYM